MSDITTTNDTSCECLGHCNKIIVKETSYYLHFPDQTEEWYCDECQPYIRDSYIRKADYRGYGNGVIFAASDFDEDDDEDDPLTHQCHTCSETMTHAQFENGKMCCDKPLFDNEEQE